MNPLERSQEEIDSPMETRSLGKLITGFLKYYAEDFPYGSSYISVPQKALLSKQEKGWASDNPDRLSIQCLIDPGILLPSLHSLDLT